MTDIKRCPHCGQIIPDGRIPAGLRLTRFQKIIFLAVKRSGENGISSSELVDTVYADDPNGGPEQAVQSIRVQINKMNTRLIDHNLLIRAPRGGRGNNGFYTLRQITCAS